MFAVVAQLEGIAESVLDQYGLFALFTLFAAYLVFIDVRSRRLEAASRERLDNDRQHIENRTSAMVTERFGFLMDREANLQVALTQTKVDLAEMRGKYVTDKSYWEIKLEVAERNTSHFKELAESNEESMQVMRTKADNLEGRLKRLEEAFEMQHRELLDERKKREMAESEKRRLERERDSLLESVQAKIDAATSPLLTRITELEIEIKRRDEKIAELEKQVKGDEHVKDA